MSDDEEESPSCEECGDTENMVFCRGCKKIFCAICYEDDHDEDEVDLRKHQKVPISSSKH